MSKEIITQQEPSISSDYDEEEDTVSIATSEGSCSGITVAEDQPPTFGNIAVANSTDIHFGNKTYYQGPVTIKQVLYANSKHSCDSETAASSDFANDNPCFIPDHYVEKIKVENVNVTQEETQERKGTQWLQSFSRHHVLLITSLATVLLLSLVTLLVVLLTRHQSSYNKFALPQYPGDSNEQDRITNPEYPVDSTENSTFPHEFRLITREEWFAQPPKEKLDKLKLPVPYVIIMHTASEFCETDDSCKKTVQDVQTFHSKGRGWSDIGYSFLVGGNGKAYEGRGWYNVGAQVYGYNTACIGIAFIGTFSKVVPPPHQIKAADELIRIGLELGAISPEYKILTARQLQTTESPGLAFYLLIKTWDRWSSTP